MATFPPRNLAAEVAKHFHGTPEQRILQALRLGRESVTLYLATLPPTTTWSEAAERLRRNRYRGRRPSAVMEARRA